MKIWETNVKWFIPLTLRVQIFQINVQLCFAFIDAHRSIEIAFGKHRPHATCLILPGLFPSRHYASFATRNDHKQRTKWIEYILRRKPAKFVTLEFWKLRRRVYEPAIQTARLQSYPFSRSGHFVYCVQSNFNFLVFSLKNDFISFWKLSGLSVLSLFYCLQMFWTVSFEYDFICGKVIACKHVSSCLEERSSSQFICFLIFFSAQSTVLFGDVWKLELHTWSLNFVR